MSKKSIRTYWLTVYVKNDVAPYIDSFGVEYIPKKVKKFIGKSNITTNVYRIQLHDSIMCIYFCIGFNSFMLTFVTLYQLIFS